MKKRTILFPILLITSIFIVFSCSEDENSITESEDETDIDQVFLPIAPEGKEWYLVWNDEFDGPVLDLTKWSHITWQTSGIDQPRKDGFWREDAAVLSGEGHLKMLTYFDSTKNRYIDGAIRTKGKFEKTYGYYEIRVLFQEEIGHWSAFWLMNDDVPTVGNNGVDGTEIDIFEKINPSDNKIFHTLHWDGYGTAHQSSHKHVANNGLDEGFHTVGVWWVEDNYTFYVDGIQTWQSNAGGICKSPLYIKITDEVGQWAGQISASDLPDIWLVDYVRVYDLADL